MLRVVSRITGGNRSRLRATAGAMGAPVVHTAMSGGPPATVALRRVGVGLLLGAAVLAALARALLPEVAALLAVALGFAAYAIERYRDAVPGVSGGLVAAGLLLVLDREVDPVGATVERSLGATVAIGVGMVLATYLVESGVLARGE